MALKFETDSRGIAYGQPGSVPITVHDRGKERGTMFVERKLLLDGQAYVTGGWTLTPGDTKMKAVHNVEQLAGYDCFGKAIQANGYQAVFVKTTPDGLNTKLKLYYNGAEVANGATAAAGKYIWVRFIGIA